MVTAVRPLEGPNAGWVVEALEGAFLRHGPPKHIISDQEGVFVSEVFRNLLSHWNVKQRFGAVGKVCFVRAHSSHGGPETFESVTDHGNYYREEFAGKIPPIYDMAVYALTTLTAVLGPVERVAAMSGTAIKERRLDKVTIPGFKPYTIRPTVHDNCMILLEWDGACLGAVDGSFCMRHNKAPGMEFYGSDGSLYASRGGGNIEIISTVPGFDRPNDWHPLKAPTGRRGREPWGAALGSHLTRCIADGTKPAFGGEHAVHVVEVMEAIFNSAQTGEMIRVRSTFD